MTVFQQKVLEYFRSGYPILAIETREEDRVREELQALMTERKGKFSWWTILDGLKGPREVKQTVPAELLKVIRNDVIKGAAERPGEEIIALQGFHFFLQDPEVIQGLKDILAPFKSQRKMLVIVSPVVQLPKELQNDITLLECPPPDLAKLNELAKNLVDIQKNLKIEPVVIEKAAEAGKGMIAMEFENACALSIIRTKTLDPFVIQEEKAQVIKKSGILEYFHSPETMDTVGGLDELKSWLKQRERAFSKEAREFGLRFPRGIVLLGPPGVGKSLVAKAVANTWRLPLLKFDFGKVFSSLVGASEAAIRLVLQTADACAPAILWMDELEKGLAGIGSSGATDSGVSARVFATFLTWMQERETTGSQIFIVGTVNRLETLTKDAPELLRKGRFDEIWVVPPPNFEERGQIFEIHLRKKKRDVLKFDIKELATRSRGYSGAEIEEAINVGLYQAFDEGKELDTGHICNALDSMVPLTKTAGEQLALLEDWCKKRARLAAKRDGGRTEGRLLDVD